MNEKKKQKNLSNREYMEMVIEVMKKSLQEPRTDKTSPKVGAVIVKEDGSVETAFRGELRDGDHAEFTLLERKNRSYCLDNSKLFATLEPCAPGARKSPKLSCAERIVLARIREVWIGIQDPDPTVDRKGIKFLQDAGVSVHMFDHDLQEIIWNENLEFITQAQERAALVEEKIVQSPVLSSLLENTISGVELEGLSEEALEQYRKFGKISAAINSVDFKQWLLQQGVLRFKENLYKPTGYGVLLFGKNPRASLPQAGLLGTIFYPNGKEETHDFDGPLIGIPLKVETWLKEKLPNIIDRNQMQRKHFSDLPFKVIREAIVNALIHRDYEIRGAKCQLMITPEAIVVKSPGATIAPITFEQLKSFKAPMLSRNPVLHYVFSRMEMAEERGLGLNSFKSCATEMKLPMPKYVWNDPYLANTLSN